jgi:hypothetical protein
VFEKHCNYRHLPPLGGECVKYYTFLDLKKVPNKRY